MTKKEKDFIQTVWEYYREFGRHDLAWRKTTDPYTILVSEIMLQQTQVDRVVPKYTAFINTFPAVADLATASLGDVLRLWQGLGYNRRAKALHNAAQQVVREYGGVFPDSYESLQILPGVGPYTAGAVLAFAYNKPVPVIETNIRTVYLHHFFKGKEGVTDEQLLQLTAVTLDQKRPREWYWALMDYGSYIKKEFGNPNKQSKTYNKQSTFQGSDRQIRGAILKALSSKPHTRNTLLKNLVHFEDIRIDAQIEKLFSEGMVNKIKNTYSLPEY